MKFKNWIEDQGGSTPLAARLGVTSMTVHQWVVGKSSPRAICMIRLVRMGRGAFTYEDIILETTAKKRKVKKV